MANEEGKSGIALSDMRKIISCRLKGCVVVSAVVGVILSALASAKTFMGGRRVFMYFTIQSNIAIAVICLIGGLLLAAGRKPGNGWFVVKFMGTVSITLTGVVFCFVLAPTLADKAWNIQNILTHVISPVCAIIDFFVTGIDAKIKKTAVVYVIIPPILYAIYAGIGYVQNWQFAPGYNYPYFFLNWGSPAGAFGFSKELPYMGCAWWILALLVFLMFVGLIFLLILDGIKKLAKR